MLGEGIVSFGVPRAGDGVGEEREVLAEDRVVQRQALVHARPGRRELDRAPVVAEAGLHRVLRALDAAELVDEVHVPGGAAQLAVGDRAQTDLLLHRDRVANRLVLRGAQLLRGQAALVVRSRAPPAARAGAAGCRRGRRGRAGPRAVRSWMGRPGMFGVKQQLACPPHGGWRDPGVAWQGRTPFGAQAGNRASLVGLPRPRTPPGGIQEPPFRVEHSRASHQP